jgi:hypothetical protein
MLLGGSMMDGTPGTLSIFGIDVTMPMCRAAAGLESQKGSTVSTYVARRPERSGATVVGLVFGIVGNGFKMK